MLTCILEGTNSLANTLKESVVSEILKKENKNKLGIRPRVVQTSNVFCAKALLLLVACTD